MIIPIKGTIVSNDDKQFYDWFGIESTSPQSVRDMLEGADEDVTVEINSGGGNLFAGVEIYSAINAYKGNKQIDVVGIAASAASVIAMAGPSRITPSGMLMIHNVSTVASGDKNDMSHESKMLSKADEAVAKAYEIKTGLDRETLLSLMGDETWLTAEDAVDSGFIDAIIPAETLVNSTARILTAKEIEDARAEMKAAKDAKLVGLENEKLNLLRMRGLK